MPASENLILQPLCSVLRSPTAFNFSKLTELGGGRGKTPNSNNILMSISEMYFIFTALPQFSHFKVSEPSVMWREEELHDALRPLE